jgi:conjugative transfer signal peptidase TraF
MIASRAQLRPQDPKSRSERAFGYSVALLCGVALVAAAAFKSAAPVLLFNPSTSAPRGWYLLSPGAPTRVGQFALARLPPADAALADERHYLPLGTNLLKQVAALHGDYVCAEGAQVRINRRIVAHLLSEDSHHRPLTPWRGCMVLGTGHYFLLGATNPASFDSRYFGPVDRGFIVGRAVPLWTWP